MAGLGKGNNVYVGIIKHLNAKSGFGIIACSDTRKIFGCDAPFLCPQLNRFSVGDTVHFKSLFDPAKGIPQAFDLSMAAQMQTTTLELRDLVDEPLRIKFVTPRNMAVQTRPSKRRKRQRKKVKKAAEKRKQKEADEADEKEIEVLQSEISSLKRQLAEARLLSTRWIQYIYMYIYLYHSSQSTCIRVRFVYFILFIMMC